AAAKAEAAAKAAAAEEAKKQAAAEAEAAAKAKAEAEAGAGPKAKEDQEMTELDALRGKRRKERMAHLAEKHDDDEAEEGVEYGEPRPVGVAGPDAVYILKTLTRWRLRGDGVQRK
ncbi:MAG: acetyl-CoA synthase, partial [Desulfarculaceae bacterium]|nr:acetyl-CoA synthase [Desulfarculaceae bacterium]